MTPDVAVIAQVVSAAAVVTGLVFGTLQIRGAAHMRALLAAIEMVRAMQTPDFTRNIRIVLALPDDADPTLVLGDPETAMALHGVTHTFESLGVLVYHRAVPLHFVDDLLGGYARSCWRKIRPTVEFRRTQVGVTYGEWMQWLVERLKQYPTQGKNQGAWKARRRWSP